MDGLLLKCLGDEQARMAMGEVHKGICGAHQNEMDAKVSRVVLADYGE
jgi:hypothetical protein